MGKLPYLVALLLVTLLGATCGLFAQSSGTVLGRVIDEKNGLPVRGAEVTLNYDARRTATSESGEFRFERVPPGAYYIQARAEGYLDYSGYPTYRFQVGAGEVSKERIVRLSGNAGAISGKVRSASGKGIKSTVVLQGVEDKTFSRRIFTEDGAFRFAGLPAQRYLLYAYGETIAERSFAPAYYPSVSGPDWASPIAVTPGKERKDVGILLRPEKWQTIRGRFAGTCPAEHECEVHYRRVPSPPSSSYSLALVATNGRFELRLPAGRMKLSVQAYTKKYGDRASLGSVVVDVPDTPPALALKDIEIPASEGHPVGVRIDSPAPLPRGRDGAGVRLIRPDFRGDNYFFRDVGNEPFQFPHVEPGIYSFHLHQLPDGYSVLNIEAAGRDITQEGLRVAGAVQSVTIHLAKAVGSVRGRVLDAAGSLLSVCQVRIERIGVSKAAASLYNASTFCASQGEFEIRNLAPGRYRVAAGLPGEGEGSASVNIVAGGTQELKIRLPGTLKPKAVRNR